MNRNNKGVSNARSADTLSRLSSTEPLKKSRNIKISALAATASPSRGGVENEGASKGASAKRMTSDAANLKPCARNDQRVTIDS